MLSADSRQQIPHCRQRPKANSQPAGRGHEHSHRWRQLSQRQGRAMDTRPHFYYNYKCDRNAYRFIFMQADKNTDDADKAVAEVGKTHKMAKDLDAEIKTILKKIQGKGSLNSAAQLCLSVA